MMICFNYIRELFGYAIKLRKTTKKMYLNYTREYSSLILNKNKCIYNNISINKYIKYLLKYLIKIEINNNSL